MSYMYNTDVIILKFSFLYNFHKFMEISHFFMEIEFNAMRKIGDTHTYSTVNA